MSAADPLHLATACLPGDDEHPRHRGLRTAGRLAALEVVGLAVIFAGCAAYDALANRIAEARGVVRRTLPTRK